MPDIIEVGYLENGDGCVRGVNYMYSQFVKAYLKRILTPSDCLVIENRSAFQFVFLTMGKPNVGFF